MSELGPLEQARQLVTGLLGRPDSASQDFKSNLTTLDGLLKQLSDAQEEVRALHAQIEAINNEHANLTSLMVHEIRKPMTSIRGYSDMLAKPGMIGPLNEMQTQFVGIIRNNIVNMQDLVANISDLNKLIAKRMKLDNKMTTFGQVILDAQKQAEPLIAESGHSVTYEVPQGLPILTVDGKQLAKIILHLLRNALQYTPKGSGQITVSAVRVEGQNGGPAGVRVTVKDNGIGLTPEEVARLGEPFYRTDHELVTQQKGYGLGIPVSMRFLELMNSKLEVSSSPGEGSTFSFVIAGMTMTS